MLITSGRFHLMFLICQTIGLCNINSIPSISSAHGTMGSILTFTAVYILLGIPLLYMELIIGQFTGRDCLDVWKIRPFLSYTGYGLIMYQVVILLYNHIMVAFTVHYFLISFEDPVPYYVCGSWSTSDCNIIVYNYTVNEDCVRHRRPADYCNRVHTTFPEYQYWRNHVLGGDKSFKLNVAWRVRLASGLVCVFIFLCCFKRNKSLKWVVIWLPIYPILVFVLLMLGSMLQKGLVVKFEEALDMGFVDYAKKFRFSNAIQQIVHSLNLGTGVSLNFGSKSSFRSNCFSKSVISVVVSTFFSILVMCTTAMMTCPYAYEYGISPGYVVKSQMSMLFEKVPRLLSEYEHKFFWLILILSCYFVVGFCTNILLIYNLTETILKRFQKCAIYPGLTCFFVVTLLFLVTMPLLSNIGIMFALSFRRYTTLASIFFLMTECLVFVVSYGVHKFSEDVHFMLRIQPSLYMRTVWFLATGFLVYSFCAELFYYYTTLRRSGAALGEMIGLCTMATICGTTAVLSIGKLLVAPCRKNSTKPLRLAQDWGPKNDILQRSRAMFSAQAMTKEYMYRQYHLQAGITARQMKSNKRNIKENDQLTTL